MWFDNAHGKEKIAYMFNNDLSLSEIEIDKFIFHDISRLTLGFNIKNLPSLIPEKWKKKQIQHFSTYINIHRGFNNKT